MYNTKNYTEQGGDVTHIGGKLIFEEGASLDGLPRATTTIPGGSLMTENQVESAASTVADLKSDFNSLLGKLKSAGVMEEDPE